MRAARGLAGALGALGWIAFLAGLVLLPGLVLPSWLGAGPDRPSFLPTPGTLLGAVAPLALVFSALALWRGANRVARLDAQELMAVDERPPVIYLGGEPTEPPSRSALNSLASGALRTLGTAIRSRSGTREQRMVAQLRVAGPVLGLLGSGGTPSQAAGAPLAVEGTPEWRTRFDGLLQRARLVVIRPSATRGLAWERRRAMDTVPPERLLLLLPDRGGAPAAAAKAALEELRERFPALGTEASSGHEVICFDARGVAMPHRHLANYLYARFGPPAAAPRWQRSIGLGSRTTRWLLVGGGVLALLLVSAYLLAGPGLLRARLHANEAAAIATLRNIISAQARFQQSGKADVNHDGYGEYGGFLELSGGGPGRMAQILTPPLLSGAFRVLNARGEVSRSGYYFRIFLPGATGIGVGEPAEGFSAKPVDAVLAEKTWCAYAWPVNQGQSGYRTFFVNQAGNLLATEDARYSGSGAGPRPDAAFHNAGAITGPPALRAKGADGLIWSQVN